MLVAVALLLMAGCSGTSDESRLSDRSESSRSAATPSPQPAEPPTRWLVTLGDSYISGEGARWGGNTSGPARTVDVLGTDAYLNASGREDVPGCHRAELPMDNGGDHRLLHKNLACSGATTGSRSNGGAFTPGVDFYTDADGHIGQLVALRRFSARHDVASVAVLIGGNDFGFGSIVGACVSAFLSAVTGSPSSCKDDDRLASALAAPVVERITERIAASLRGVGEAMRRAGYDAADYDVVVANYPSPLPEGPRMRYREDFLHRFVAGGCPVLDHDATWANRVVLDTINSSIARAVSLSGLPNVVTVDLSQAFRGHRLCEVGVSQLQETSLRSWTSAGAKDQVEWVNMLSGKPAPWQPRESLHPNYWGTLAVRGCIRAAVERKTPTAGRCTRGEFEPRS